MGDFSKEWHKIVWIKVKFLSVVWAAAQHTFNEAKARKIAELIDPDAFGVITVTQPNGDGVHHVIDGQHRKVAVEIDGGPDQMVPCVVLPVKDPKRAADLFIKINTGRSKPNAVDLFRAGVTAGHEVEVAIEGLVTGLGYRIGRDTAPGVIRAVSACTTVYIRHGGAVLKDALLVIHGTWGKDGSALEGAMIRGYAGMLAAHGDRVDRQRLVDRVAKKYTPGQLLSTARTACDTAGGTLADNAGRVLVEIYNRGLRKGQL